MRQRASGSSPAAGGPQGYYGGYSGGNNGYSSNGSYGGYNAGSQQGYGGYNAGAAYSSPSMSGYAAAPASTDNKYAKSKRKSSSAMPVDNPVLVVILILLGLWSVAMLGLWMNVRGKYNSILTEFNVPNSNALMDLYKTLQSDLADIQRKKDREIRQNDKKFAGRESELQRQNKLLQKERDELLVKYEGPDKEEASERLQLREEAFQNQVELLQEATRKESKRNVLERYVGNFWSK